MSTEQIGKYINKPLYYGQLIFHKTSNDRNDSLLTNGFKTTGYQYVKKMDLTLRRKTSVGEDMDKLELSCIISKDVQWYSHFEKQFGSFLRS